METLCRTWCIPEMSALAQRLIYYEEKYVEVITYLPRVPAQRARPVFELNQMLFTNTKEWRERWGKEC